MGRRYSRKLASTEPVAQKFTLNPIKPGEGEGTFASGKFRFKFSLKNLWYEPVTSWGFLTFTWLYFAGKKNWKSTKLLG